MTDNDNEITNAAVKVKFIEYMEQSAARMSSLIRGNRIMEIVFVVFVMIILISMLMLLSGTGFENLFG